MYAHGWYCVAFESEITQDLTPVTLGRRRLMLVRTEAAGLAAFDADCPHRGAHLARGGRIDDGHVVCPFHNYRIRLGGGAQPCFSVRAYETMAVGGAVFVSLSDQKRNGWRELLEALLVDHRIVAGFTLPLDASIEAVIENGFDRRHFESIHRIGLEPLEVRTDAAGAVVVESSMRVPGVADAVSYKATTISPGLIIVQLGGPQPYGIITGVIPVAPNRCVARLCFVLPKEHGSAGGLGPDLDGLIGYSRKGLADDERVWRHLSTTASQALTEDDWPIRRFQSFCESFEETASSTNS